MALVKTDPTPMSRFVVRYRDGRRVEFTAFSQRIALDWASSQGVMQSWASWLDDRGLTTAPKWS